MKELEMTNASDSGSETNTKDLNAQRRSFYFGGRQRRASRMTSRVLIAALILATVWAGFTDLPEMAHAKGKIVPVSLPRPIEHLDGGEIEEILVREGNYVAANKPILRLSPTLIQAEGEQLKLRATAIQRNIDRIEIVISVVEGSVKDRDVRAKWGYGFRLQSQLESFKTRLALISERVSDIEEAHVIRNRIYRNTVALEETFQIEMRAVDRLSAKGVISRTELSRYETRRLEVEGNRLRALSSLTDSQQSLSEAIRERDEFIARTRDDLIAEVEALREEIGLVHEAIAEIDARRSRLTIFSPVEGVVEKLHVTGPGEVIAPGDLVAVVLPTQDRLIAEVRLQPNDIGHIEVGDAVELKSTTFNAKKYGVQLGEVMEISPNSQLNDQNEAYFKVRISLTNVRGGDQSLDRRLSAGMEVNASIRTDVRSVLDYVVSPIRSPIERAFYER